MKREYFACLIMICLLVFFIRPEDNFKPDTLADITRDQLHNIVRNEGYDCDSVALIKRNRNNIKIGCDTAQGYKKYIVYKNDYGFNKASVDE